MDGGGGFRIMMFGLPGILEQSSGLKLKYCPQDTTGFFLFDVDFIPEETLTNYCPRDNTGYYDFDYTQTQAGTWTPAELLTTLWLDADDSSTITQANKEVSQWNDKSGNGYHVSQATQANRPLTNQPSIITFNFRNHIAFNTTAKRLLNTAWSFTLTSQHIFIVFSQTTNGRMFSQSNSGVDTGTGMYVSSHTASATSIGSFLGSTTLRAGVTIATANNQVNLFESRHDGTTLFNSINANTEVSFAQALNATTTRMGLNVALNASNGVGNGGVRNIGEILIFNNTSLSTDDREKVQGYLAWKWNLISLLPSAHPYKTTPPNL